MSQMTTIEMLRLQDGRGLCVRRWTGSDDGTLVLLHGLLDSAEGWTRLCEPLSGARVAFDLPGFGYSDPPSRGSLAGYARDVAQALQTLEIERFSLIGHSLGGAVAVALSELMPERIDALVLLAPAGFGRIRLAEAAWIPGVRELMAAALPFALSSRLAVTAGYMAMVSKGRAPERGLVERVSSRGGWLSRGVHEATRAVVEAGRSADAFHHRRLRFGGPVHAVWGEHDRLVPAAHAGGLRSAFPQARIEIWPGMGHHPTWERLEDLVALVARLTGPGRATAELAANAYATAA